MPGILKLLLSVASRFLRIICVGDISAGPEPIDNATLAVTDRHAARLEPAINSVVPPNAVFHIVGVSLCYRTRPNLPRTMPIIGMENIHPAPTEQLTLGDPGVLRPLGAKIVARAVRRGRPDKLRQRLDQ